jgi:ATP phosphoribosyltransferase regulatory subunit HisZ
MTKEQKAEYGETDELREILKQALAGKKFRLDCGHFVSFGYYLGNNMTIYNGKKLKIVCSQGGY